eukprot:236405_1
MQKRLSKTKYHPKKPNPQIVSISFNQDGRCITVATKTGFRIYNCRNFRRRFSEAVPGGVSLVEMLFSTSLVLVVGGGYRPAFSPRHIRILNTTKKERLIGQLDFVDSVLALKINRERLAAVTQRKIFLFNASSLKILTEIEIPPNPNGAFAFSSNVQNCYMAYPVNANQGHLAVYDTLNLQKLSVLNAHGNPIRQIIFNLEGTIMATASVQGTVIRIWTVPSCRKLHEFRRGSVWNEITAIAFNKPATFLAVASRSATVHLFDMRRQEPKTPEEPFWSPHNAVSALSGFLPQSLRTHLEP